MGDEVSCQSARYRYFNCKLNREVVKLLPGEFYVSVDDVVMETVLGSCVAACRSEEQRLNSSHAT